MEYVVNRTFVLTTKEGKAIPNNYSEGDDNNSEMGDKVILAVIVLSFLLMFTTTSEGSCGPPRRGQHLHYDVSTDSDFRLWLKMEEKNTQLNATIIALVDNRPQAGYYKSWKILSNTEKYISFSAADFRKLLKAFSTVAVTITSVNITSSASMEWIYCKNSNCFSANTNASCVPASNTKVVTVLVVMVVMLVVVLLVVVVVLAAAGAYIHRLRKTSNQSTKPILNKEQVAVLVVLVLLVVGELVVVVVITAV